MELQKVLGISNVVYVQSVYTAHNKNNSNPSITYKKYNKVIDLIQEFSKLPSKHNLDGFIQ